jgi:uncharacterized membrane protein
VFFPKEELTPLDLTVEEGIKFFVSGGIVSPERFSQKDVLPA